MRDYRNQPVTIADFMRLQTRFGQSGGWSDGDSDYSGLIDVADLMGLQANMGRTLAPGAAESPVAADPPTPTALPIRRSRPSLRTLTSALWRD